MKIRNVLGMGLFILLLPVASIAADALQDPDISVQPVVAQFPVTMLGGSSKPVPFIITNHSAGILPLASMALGGVNPTEFTMGASSCTATLAPGASCTVEVSFSPAGRGSKNANLLIPYGSSKTLTAFLTNTTSAVVEAQRRLAPVLSSIVIPDSLVPGSTYTLTWSLEGYDSNNMTNIMLFDCTGISDGSCGNNYTDSSKFAESTPIAASSAASAGNWTYSGVRTKLF